MALPKYEGVHPGVRFPSMIVGDPTKQRIRFFLRKDGVVVTAGRAVHYPDYAHFTVHDVRTDGTARVSVTFPSDPNTHHIIEVPAQTHVWVVDGKLHMEKCPEEEFCVLEMGVRATPTAAIEVEAA